MREISDRALANFEAILERVISHTLDGKVIWASEEEKIINFEGEEERISGRVFYAELKGLQFFFFFGEKDTPNLALQIGIDTNLDNLEDPSPKWEYLRLEGFLDLYDLLKGIHTQVFGRKEPGVVFDNEDIKPALDSVISMVFKRLPL